LVDSREYERLREIYEAVLPLRGDEREAALHELCAHDDRLREEVAQLLAITERTLAPDHPLAEARIARARKQLDASVDQVASEGEPLVGRYRIVRRIARGGMGTVYEAEQDAPKRRVALKVVDPHLASPALLKRFGREGEILGRLQHPGIAHIHESGVEDGRPYFAMEFVDGETITKHAETHGLDLRGRIELLAHVCDAVEYAHGKGIVHRDLKPDNILVNDRGAPKVLDFGIARVVEEGESSLAATMTREGQVLGTLTYMAPEQVTGRLDHITPRTDVYALGVIAFELLAGRLPHDLAGLSWSGAMMTVERGVVPRLSTVDSALRGDVDTIVATCLEPEPGRRYVGAGALASDLRRFLTDRPIVARPASAMYQARKFVRRNRALVTGVVGVFAVLVIGVVASSLFAVSAERQRARAQQALDDLESVSAFQETQLSDIDVPDMGQRMHRALLDKLSVTMEREGRSESDIQAARARLDAAMEPINFTDASMTVLSENIIDRSRLAIDEEFADQPPIRARMLQTFASTTQSLGLHEHAAEARAEACRVRIELLPAAHEDRLETEVDVFVHRDHFAELPEIVDEADVLWGRCRRSLGDEHPTTRRAEARLRVLANFFGQRSRIESGGDARDVSALEAELAAAVKAYGSDDERTIRLMSRLAAKQRFRGRGDRAAELYRVIWQHRRRTLGDDHPETITTLWRLANNTQTDRQLEELMPALWHAVEVKRARGTLKAIEHHNFGMMLANLGHYDEAETVLREALELRSDHGGGLGRHVHRSNLAGVIAARGRLDEAEELMLQVLKDVEGWKPEGRGVARLRRALAMIYIRQQRFEEAESILLPDYDLLAAHDPGHLWTLGVHHSIITLYATWDDAAPGQGHDARAAAWRATLPGEEPARDTAASHE
jgi:tRNA A-37 threonylcarbamoyl transferase component Bud32/Flp pilus assembly protein TadD